MTCKGAPIRRFGSAAIDLSYVAAGRFDAYWEVSLQPWDFAGGKLLVEEAGGKISQYDGSPCDLFKASTILASNGLLHAEMQKEIR
jgi:myo-inositol-1(or 4)-monophosphatase